MKRGQSVFSALIWGALLLATLAVVLTPLIYQVSDAQGFVPNDNLTYAALVLIIPFVLGAILWSILAVVRSA